MAEETNIATMAPATTPPPAAPPKVDTKPDVKVTPGGQDANPPKAPNETKVIPEVKKYKVKVDGKDAEVTEDELIRGYAHMTAANKKFQEAAMTRKQAEEFIGMLKTNPLKVLKDPRLGHDARKLAEEFLVEEMQKELMTPEQKELYEAKEKLRANEEKEKSETKQKEEAQLAELTAKYTEEYSKDIVSALKTSGLPQTEHTVKRMAYYMHQALLKGYELKAADVVSLVREDFKTESKSLLDQLDGATLLEFLGDNAAKKLADFNLAKLKSVGNKVPPTGQGIKDGDDSPKAKKMTKAEWRKKLEAI